MRWYRPIRVLPSKSAMLFAYVVALKMCAPQNPDQVNNVGTLIGRSHISHIIQKELTQLAGKSFVISIIHYYKLFFSLVLFLLEKSCTHSIYFISY